VDRQRISTPTKARAAAAELPPNDVAHQALGCALAGLGAHSTRHVDCSILVIHNRSQAVGQPNFLPHAMPGKEGIAPCPG
jgi:hypothetical protein